jgi:TPR repeat protein
LELADRYYKLAANHGDSEAQCILGLRLLHPDIADHSTAARYLRSSADGGNPAAQLNFAHLLEEGIGVTADHILAAKYYELASQSSAVGCACYGWCCQKGRGVPVNFTEAAELFEMAAACENADGENGFAICLERGLGIEKDMQQAVSYYRRAASQRHPAGMNNFERCLEHVLRIERDLPRAATYYRMAAELKNADGVNNFGVCLERGIGIRANIDLAAEFYKRAADHGDADGANNFGFCLEYGHRILQTGGRSGTSGSRSQSSPISSLARPVDLSRTIVRRIEAKAIL